MRYTLRGSSSAALLLALLLLSPLSAGARGGTRHVLLLSSAERPFAPQSGFADALVRDLIRTSHEPIQIVELPVQPVRATGQAPDLSVAQRIRSSFAADPLDLVVTIGGPAATFAQQFRPQLFPTTPMLMAGVDRRFVEHGTFTDHETTVATEHDPAAMIDEIVRLLPDTRTVMVVVGASPVEQFWLQEMKREFGRFGNRLRFTWTNELSYEEILERCRTMPAHSAIFYAVLSVDGKGEPRVNGDTVQSLHDAAAAPLFALYGMGQGIVGGPLLSTDELSHTTVQVALRVLAGESPGSIKTPVQRTGQPAYDARELRRWNIDQRRLPPASLVLFREPTTWERHRRAITLAALGGIPVVALLVFAGHRRARRTQRRGPAAEAVLASSPADAIVRAWTADATGRRVAAGAGVEDWTAAVHPDDVDRCRASYRRALERREPFQMEYRIQEAGGGERWILDTGLVRSSGKTFDGYVGSAVDITSLGRARAELSNLSRHLIQAHERERAAFAKTLHEDVCQRMMALTLRLHMLQGSAHDAEVIEIREQLASLVAEIAAVSDPVYSRLELLGLTAAGRRFCEDLAAEYNVAVHFHDEGVPRTLPADVALALFRVLQGATVNAVLHSKAHEVWVSLRAAAGELRLRIVDRGIGFDPERPVPGGGVGLVAIRERLKLANGDCRIASVPGDGTRVEAWVPLQLEPEPALR